MPATAPDGSKATEVPKWAPREKERNHEATPHTDTQKQNLHHEGGEEKDFWEHDMKSAPKSSTALNSASDIKLPING